MKRFLTAALVAATCLSGVACAADAHHPWADNSGGTETTHIAAMGQDPNAQHQQVTKTNEGYGRRTPEASALMKRHYPAQSRLFAGDPSLMPHQG